MCTSPPAPVLGHEVDLTTAEDRPMEAPHGSGAVRQSPFWRSVGLKKVLIISLILSAARPGNLWAPQTPPGGCSKSLFSLWAAPVGP